MQIEIYLDLIELRRIGVTEVEIRYAGVHVLPNGHLVGSRGTDEEVEELRPVQVQIIAERIERMSVYRQMEINCGC